MSAGIPITLTFFCELDGKALKALFSDASVTDRLRALGARVSLGILDFSDERAAVVCQLNSAGVPVIAWQLLSREQGYWYNLCNAAQASERYKEFLAWTEQRGLRWAGIGVDIEPDISEIQQLLTHKSRLIRTVLKRGCGKKRFSEARAAYHALVERMHVDGYPVHSYEFPFMVDDQRVGSSWLQRIFGVTDVPSDQRVLMIYSSFFRPYGSAVLCNYARDADSVGIGLTGGGVELDGIEHLAPLSWNEFTRDLRFAGSCCREIHVFSLEGCVRQGFLERLQDLDWNCVAKCPQPWTAFVALLRAGLRAALWSMVHPYAVAGFLVCMLLLLVY